MSRTVLFLVLVLMAVYAQADCTCACVNGQAVPICSANEPPPLCNQMCAPSASQLGPMPMQNPAGCFNQMGIDPLTGGLRWQQVCQ